MARIETTVQPSTKPEVRSSTRCPMCILSGNNGFGTIMMIPINSANMIPIVIPESRGDPRMRNRMGIAVAAQTSPRAKVTVVQKPSSGCNIKWKPGNEPLYFITH